MQRVRFLVLLLVLMGFSLPAHAAGRLTLTVFENPDVQRGAGLAVIIQSPSGKTYLYDTGAAYPSRLSSDGWEAKFNAGRDIIAPYLKAAGIAKIDAVMMSHAHYDHFGGMMWLEGHIPMDRLIDSGFTYTDPEKSSLNVELADYEVLREKFKQRGAYLAAHAGDTIDLEPDLKIEVIAPPKTFFPDRKASTRQAHDSPGHYLVNANSLGLRMQHGDIVFYLPGDIQTEDIELSLLPFVDKAKIKCHVLIAPGHGIHCTKEFAEATRPEVSIASVFPRYAKGLKSTPMLKAVGAKTYITGLNGNVQVISDGTTYSVKCDREDGAAAPAPPAVKPGS